LSTGPIIGNEFVNDSTSFWIDGNVSAAVYHNDFSGDSAWYLHDTSVSQWNASYPVAGNYWSNYTGTDLLGGPAQNLPGADGIGDTPMILNATTFDHYPLMVAWAQHQVTFVQSGLPSGMPWGVVVNGVRWTTGGLVVVIDSGNNASESYVYTALAVAGYSVAPSSGAGSIGLAGAPTTVSIVYSRIPTSTYTVAFDQTGLPLGTPWSVTVNGSTVSSTNGTAVFILPSGNYSYSVGAIPGYTVAPNGGEVSVANGVTTVSLQFTAVVYRTTVVESGLPAGTSWSISIGGNDTTGSASNVTTALTNGSYTVVPGAVSGYTVTPTSTDLVVAGGPVTLFLVYAANSTVPPTTNPPITIPTLSSSQSTTVFWGAIIALAVIAAVGWILALRRRPKREDPPPTPGTSPASANSSPGSRPPSEPPSG
jgi:hypothetical protein